MATPGKQDYKEGMREQVLHCQQAIRRVESRRSGVPRDVLYLAQQAQGKASCTRREIRLK